MRNPLAVALLLVASLASAQLPDSSRELVGRWGLSRVRLESAARNTSERAISFDISAIAGSTLSDTPDLVMTLEEIGVALFIEPGTENAYTRSWDLSDEGQLEFYEDFDGLDFAYGLIPLDRNTMVLLESPAVVDLERGQLVQFIWIARRR